jgi:small-conductance mechanosensitive channel
VKLRLAPGAEPQRVLPLLEEVARAHENVLKDPAPHAVFLGFGESARDYELRAWTSLPDQLAATQSELALALAKALGEAGMEVRDLQLRSDAAPRPPGL